MSDSEQQNDNLDLINDMLAEVVDELEASRNRINLLKNPPLITSELLNEVLDVVENTRDVSKLELLAERNYQTETREALIETCKYVTEITGFRCNTYTIATKKYPSLKAIFTCYCPKLKLNFYFESLFKVPDGREFVYYDIVPNGMYARMHNEYLAVYEAIRNEKHIIDYELPYNYITKSSGEKREYILNVIKQLTQLKCYVGGAIDPQFPQREPESESDEEFDEQQHIMNFLGMMMYHPDNPHDFDFDFDDSVI